MGIKRTNKVRWITLSVLAVSVVLIVGLALNFFALNQAQSEALQELNQRIGEYDEKSIVLYGTSKAKAEDLAEHLDAKLRITSNGRFATLTLPDGVTIRDVFADKENRRFIKDMSADYQVSTSEVEEVEEYVSEKLVERPYTQVTDSLYSYQGYLDYLNFRDVWNYRSGNGVTVAVIDTGIDTDHPEFQGIISEYSYNATEDKIVKDYNDWSLVEDEQGHGTAVAGVIVAPMDNGGMIGIAPKAELLVIKAECNELGEFERTSDLVFGLYYAIERDVDVVNMSFGTYGTNPFAEPAQLAYDSDIICVAAAGNNSTTELSYPAADKNVIGVGALAGDGWELAYYSNYGENTNLVAPGTTYTAKVGGSYGKMTGTSFASPIVAGAIALYLENDPYTTFDKVTEQLYISTYDLGDLGNDWYFGFGALDINTLINKERGKITYDMLTDEVENIQGAFVRGHALQAVPAPERLYAVFDGWYYDDTFTQEYNYYTDRFYGDLTLYAKWVNEEDGVPYTYVELDDGTIEIRSYTGKRKYITVPEKINGKCVSSIGDFAFKDNRDLRQVVLPDTLNHIGISAFEGCANMVTVYIPESVTEIEERALYGNIRLSTLAFLGNSKLITVGNYAFSQCSSLREVVIPASVKNLNGSAFFGASSLKSIKVQKGSTTFVSKDGVLFNYSGSTLVAFPAAKGKTYTLPDSAVTIGDCAFGYSKLETIDLNRVQVLGEYSFSNAMLQTLNIPDNVVSAGDNAFAYCFNLSDVTIGKGLATISSKMFFYNGSLEKITIPNTVITIASKAFCSAALREVTFEANSTLAQIEDGVFYDCQITKIAIPASVIVIGNEAFAGLYSGNPLTEVTFEGNSQLLAIGNNAFEKCFELEGITLPKRIEYIGELAFAHSGLQDILVPASVTELGYGAFAGCYGISDIKVETGNSVYYDNNGVVYTKDNRTVHAYPSGKEAFAYEILGGVETVAPYAFGYTKVQSVKLPETLTQISEYAFYYASVDQIEVPDNVLQIGRFSFAFAKNLQRVSFGVNAKLPRIGYEAFAYTSIYELIIPANVSTIAQGAFKGVTNLYSITFAENSKLESISAYMFDGCENLTSLTFEKGSSLKSIQAHGLEGMAQLQSIQFGDAQIENVDNFAFRFCTSLQEVTLPASLKTIGRYAFYDCRSLSKLTVPSNVEHIGSYAFLGTNNIDIFFDSALLPLYLDENWDYSIKGYYTGVSDTFTKGDFECAKLSSGDVSILRYNGKETHIDLTAIDFGGNVTVIGGGAFKDTTVKTIVLPNTVISIQAEAFAYTKLEKITIPAAVTFIGREAFAKSDIAELVFASGSKISFIEQYAFTGTEKLNAVTLPASLTTMGTGAFSQSGITSVTFENGIALSTIAQKAFAETKLVSVKLPDSVTLVDHNAFNNVQTLKSVSFGNNSGIRLMSNAFYHTGLETLHIPANVTYIGEYCFVALTKLNEITVDANNPNYVSVDGLLLSKNQRKLITVPAGRSGVLTVPASVEEIGFGAFEESKLTKVLFDSNANILSLGYRAFFKSALTEITVPSSVVAIDYYAFAYCDDLTTVIFEEGSQLKGIYEGAFCGDSNLENITVPESIVEISDFAFYACTKIKDIPVENNEQLKGIFDYAFAYTGISGDFVVPESVIDIGDYAFMGTDITSLVIPDTNKLELLIGVGAFQECNKVEEVTLPFVGSSFENVFESWFGYIFGAGKGEGNKTYVPESLKKVTITEGISIIGPYGFYECDSVEEISIPESVSVVTVTAFEKTTAKYELKNTMTFVDYDWMGNTYYYSSLYHQHLGSGISGILKIAEGIESVSLVELRSLEGILLPQNVKTLYLHDLTNLKELVMHEGVVSASVYHCQAIEKVELPSSIEGFEFTWCTSLKEVKLPNNLKTIPMGAFSECYALEHIDIPDSVTKIGGSAFGNCTSLKTVNIPAGVTEIGSFAFYGCRCLGDIVIPDGVKVIADNAFSGCSALRSVSLPASLEKIGSYAFHSTGLKEVNMPSSVTFVGDYAFGWCGEMYRITVSEKLAHIGNDAFRDCDNLWEIINNSSFELEFGSTDNGYLAHYAKKITDKNENVRYKDGTAEFETIVTPDEFKFTKENGVYTLDAYLGNQDTVTLPTQINGNSYNIRKFTGGKHIVVPAMVAISDWAFSGNKTIESVTCADGVAYVGEGAFYNCSNLKKVVLPEGLENVSSNLCYNCPLLEDVNIPNGVVEIRGYAFAQCTSLESITLPESLLWIFGESFKDSGLREIMIPKNVIQIWGSAFSNTPLEKIQIHKENSAFAEIDGMIYSKDITTLVYVPDSVTSITIPKTVTYLNGVFNGKDLLEEVRFETGSMLREIQYMEFANCENLKTIVLPDGLTSIGYGAFMQCPKLESVNIPANVTIIEDMAFDSCESLKELHLPASLSSLGSECFGHCKALKLTVDAGNAHYTMQNGVLYTKGMTKILWISYAETLEITVPNTVDVTDVSNWHTFKMHDNIVKVVLPEGLTETVHYMFGDCRELREVVLPSTITKISTNAFTSCYKLQNITLPEGVQEIGNYAFTNCYNLKHIQFPDSLKKIGSGAFSSCGLTTVELPEGIERIEDGAFAYEDFLMRIVIPKTVTYISDSAFESCTLAEIINYSDYAINFNNAGKWAKAIVDKNGNRSYPEGVTDYEVIITQDGFLFIKENGKYTLRKYVGTEDTVTLPQNINGNDYSIYLFDGAKNVIIPQGRTEIEPSAFCNAGIMWHEPTLESVVIPEGVKTIGDSAFSRCYNLKRVVIPDSVENIRGYAFYECTSLTEIKLPKGLMTLENGVFLDCEKLARVVYEGSEAWIQSGIFDGSAFYNNDANWKNGSLCIGANLIKVREDLEYLVVGDEITNIAEGAFANCHSLKMLTISNYRYGTFAQLTNLQTLVLDGYGTHNLQAAFSYTFPATLKSIVLTSDFSFRSDDYYGLFDDCPDVTIYVEKEEQDLRWDANFPGWSCGYRVRYGDEWTWLTFLDSDGELVYRQPRLVNQVIIRPYISNPEPAGDIAYQFAGWDLDGDGISDSIPATSVTDISATAIFAKVKRQHSISFIDQDGTVYSDTMVDYGDTITAPAVPQKKGHSFLGWSNYTDGLVADENMVFVAQWKHDGNGHNWATPVVVPAKCTEGGYTVTTCTVCDQQTITDITTPLGHAWGDAVQTVAPTCNKDGSGYHTCTACGEMEDIVIEMNGHSFVVESETESTCTNHGLTKLVCSVCGERMEESKSLLSHSYEKQTVNQAMIVELRKTVPNILFVEENNETKCFKCTECDRFMLMGEKTVGASVKVQSVCWHTELSDWEELIPANCVSFGIEVRYCVDCDMPIELRIGSTSGTGHLWGNWYVVEKSTCTQKGTEKRECTACDHYETRDLPISAHSYKEAVTPPTCTEKGYTTHRCDCGHSYVDTYVDAKGHSFGNWFVSDPATCTQKGTEKRECTACDHYETKELPLTTHSYKDTVTPPTCTEKGYTTHRCDCGHSYVDGYTDAKGHSFTNYVSDGNATIDADGTKTAQCDRNCGAKDTVTDVGSKLKFDSITSDVYDVTDDYISGVSIKTTVDKITANIKEKDQIRVVKDGSVVSENTVLATGMKIQLMNGNEVMKEVTVVVTGDTNGDGNISITDMISVKADLLKKSQLSGAYSQAADTNGDNAISITDFIQLKAHILGKSSLEKPEVKQVSEENRGSVTMQTCEVAQEDIQKETTQVKICYLSSGEFLVPERFAIQADVASGRKETLNL